MAVRLAEEEIRRTEAVLKLQAAEEKALVMEQEIREECWAEMEARMEEEKERWRKARDEERARGEKYLDGKIEILEKGAIFEIHEDVTTKKQDGRIGEAERENEVLKSKVEFLEREIQQRSPTKRQKAKPSILQEGANPNPITNPFLSSLRGSIGEENMALDDFGGFGLQIRSPRKESLRRVVGKDDLLSPRKVSVPKTPGTAKKQRKLTTRKWDLGDVGSDAEY